jgi:hypothetical protein
MLFGVCRLLAAAVPAQQDSQRLWFSGIKHSITPFITGHVTLCWLHFLTEQLLLDHQLLGPPLTAKLNVVASYGSFNLQQLSVQQLVTTFLPTMLPREWRSAASVSWPAENAVGISW